MRMQYKQYTRNIIVLCSVLAKAKLLVDLRGLIIYALH